MITRQPNFWLVFRSKDDLIGSRRPNCSISDIANDLICKFWVVLLVFEVDVGTST